MNSLAIPSFRRVLLKLSGEALMGNQAHGICPTFLEDLVSQIKELVGRGIQISLVVGGGNFFRGRLGERRGWDLTTSDHMGMMATQMNALALVGGCRDQGLKAHVMSAVSSVGCLAFSAHRAIELLEAGEVVIFAGGTGNPYFTTDTAGVLRALETKSDLLLKGTLIDGVYKEDPHKNPEASLYERLSFKQALEENLRVMDLTAFTLASENNLPTLIFSILRKRALVNVLEGQKPFSLLTTDPL